MTDASTRTISRSRFLAAIGILAMFVAWGAVALEDRDFAPSAVDLDLSHVSSLPAVRGAKVVPNQKYRGVMDLVDRGEPVIITVELPKAADYRLKLKLGIAEEGQQVDVAWNGRPLTILRGTRQGRAEKFLLSVTHDMTRPGLNTVTLVNHGPPGSARYEQVKLENYRTVIFKKTCYLLQGRRVTGRIPIAWGRVLAVWAMLVVVILAANVVGLAVLGWASDHRAAAAQYLWGVEWGLAGVAAGLSLVSRVTPYRLVLLQGAYWKILAVLWGGAWALAVILALLVRVALGCVRLIRSLPIIGDRLVRALEKTQAPSQAVAGSRALWEAARVIVQLLWSFIWWMARQVAWLVWVLAVRVIPRALGFVIRWFWRHQSAPGYIRIFAVLLILSWICTWLGWTKMTPSVEDAAWVAILISATLYAWRALRKAPADQDPSCE